MNYKRSITFGVDKDGNLQFPSGTSEEDKRSVMLGVSTAGMGAGFREGDDGCQRWLEDGETVTFTVSRQTYSNAEFIINNRPDCKMWFSQFNMIFLSGEEKGAHFGIFRLKDGKMDLFRNLSASEFAAMVKGRRFEVHIVPNMTAINEWSEKCRGFGTVGEIVDHIEKIISENRINDLNGLLKNGACYCLEEV